MGDQVPLPSFNLNLTPRFTSLLPLVTLQPEIIAKSIPKTFFHETEMRFSKKIISKQFVHVVL